MEKKIKKVRIRPKYIKDETGKTVEVFLDMKSYNEMIRRINEFEKIKKRFKDEK